MIYSSISKSSVALAILMLGLASPGAKAQQAPDSVQTIDGRTIAGTVTLGPGAVQVVSVDGKPVEVKFDDLREVHIEPRQPSTAKDEAGAPVRHGLKAEYFSDPYFKQLRCVRLENRLDYQAGSDLPTLACDNDYSIRWSGRLVSDVDGIFTIRAVGDGVRSIVLRGHRNDGALFMGESPEASSGLIPFKSNEPLDIIVEAKGVTPYAAITLLWGRGAGAQQIVSSDHLLPPPEFTDAAWREWLKTDAGAGLVAEYFDGRVFDKPALVALEPMPVAGERGPRRSSIIPYGIRWTGQLELPLDGSYELFAQKQTPQPIRVWIDSKLVIDTFAWELDRIPSCKLSGKAGQKFDLRVETSRKEGRGGEELPLLTWSGPNWKEVPVPRDRFFPPAKVQRPWVTLLPPVAGSSENTNVEVVLGGQASQGPLTVDLLDPEGHVLGTDKEPPYRFEVPRFMPDEGPKTEKGKSEPKEIREFIARVTDASGNVGVSNTQSLPGRPSKPSAIGDGWLEALVGRIYPYHLAPRRVSPRKLEFPGMGGEVLHSSDGFHFVYQPLSGQGGIQAKFSVTEMAEEKAALTGGIMIRDEIDARSRYLGIFSSRGQLVVIRRDRPSALPSMSAVPGVQLPCWVRLARLNGRLVASTSPDGAAWTPVAVDPMTVMGTVYVGMSNLGHRGDLATFESLTLQNAGPEDAAFPPGIQTASGSVLGGRISAIDDKFVTLAHPSAQPLKIRRSDVARIFLRAVSPATLENIHDQRGVLLPQGDVFEGGITSLSPEKVDVDSVIFGPRSFTVADAAGVILNPVAPTDSVRFEIQLSDGSKFLADDLKIEQADVLIQESRLGSFRMPISQVRGIRRVAR